MKKPTWLLREYKRVKRELAARPDGYRMPCFAHWPIAQKGCATCAKAAAERSPGVEEE